MSRREQRSLLSCVPLPRLKHNAGTPRKIALRTRHGELLLHQLARQAFEAMTKEAELVQLEREIEGINHQLERLEAHLARITQRGL